YPAVARYMGYTKGGRLTKKGIGVGIDSITGGSSTSAVEGESHSRRPADESTNTRISDMYGNDNMSHKRVASIFHNLEKVTQLLAPYWFRSSSSNMRRGGSL
ncbi:MAG TPA: hypothetical protein VE593_06850, partial [Nitrososphaeraceae archaeon]|nr:hypothetical protein [Nitrososphaeraceae archaeon]